MQVRMESEAQMRARKRKGKGRRKAGRPVGAAAPAPNRAAQEASRDMARRHEEWVERLAADPASFAAIELEVHARMRQHADVFVAGLLAQASERPEMAGHVARVLEQVELGPVEKKDGR